MTINTQKEVKMNIITMLEYLAFSFGI